MSRLGILTLSLGIVGALATLALGLGLPGPGPGPTDPDPEKDGAIRADVHNGQGGAPVGFAMLNTAAKGVLNVNVELMKAAPSTEFKVTIEGSIPMVEAGMLETKANGKGSFHYKYDLPEAAKEAGKVGVKITLVHADPDTGAPLVTYSTDRVSVDVR